MSLSIALRDQSWAAVQSSLSQRQREVFIKLAELKAASAWDLATRLGREVYTVRPRLTELRKMGYVQEAGVKWHEGTKRSETCWQIDPQVFRRKANDVQSPILETEK